MRIKYRFIFLCLIVGLGCTAVRQPNLTLQPESEKLMKQGVVYLKLGQLDKARASFEVSHESFPNPGALDGLGVLALKAGRDREAEQYFVEAFKLDANYYQAMANLAFLYEQRGLIDDAVRLYRFVLTHDPTNFKARNNFAVLVHEHKLDQINHLNDVRAELERAKALEDDPIIDNNLYLVR